MDLVEYLNRRYEEERSAPAYRELCTRCFQNKLGCYCSLIRRFDPGIQFKILIHPIELRRRIATGRMAHLCLEGSSLIRGEDFSSCSEVNQMLEDPSVFPVVLYPGPKSINLTELKISERQILFPKDRSLAVFVIDGTWWSSRKTIRSTNLSRLPRISFSPTSPSMFRVRKQPAENFLSTIEAIHQVIELMGNDRDFKTENREHDALLRVFDYMVERQLKFARSHRSNRQVKD